MNDKFKMLALQAQMGTADFDVGSYYVATPDKMQLFAELIVRECAKAAGDFEYARLHDSLVEEHILKHFGVEEK